MRYFVIARHRESGDVRLVSDASYGTREQALDGLASAVAEDAALGAQDLFVVDLDTVTPVVLLAPPLGVGAPMGEPMAEPMADAWETPAPAVDALAEIAAVEDAALEGPPIVWAADVDAPVEDAATKTSEVETPEVAAVEPAPVEPMSWSAPVPETPPAEEVPAFEDVPAAPPVQEESGTPDAVEEPGTSESSDVIEPAVWALSLGEQEPPDDGAASLADALRRAAERMEAEGIVVAPEVEELAARGVGPQAEAPEGVTEPAAAAAWPWEPEAATQDPQPELPTGISSDAPLAEASTPVETEDVPVDGMQETPLPGWVASAPFEPVGIEEPGLEEITLLTPVSYADDAAPLIVGEYAAALDEEPMPPTDEEAHASDTSDEADAGSLDDAAMASPDAVAEVSAEPFGIGSAEDLAADAEPEQVDDPAAAAEAAYERAAESAREALKAYEPGGSDIAAYTCADCVYVDTCPKANQDGPATCGSFQWKSV